MTSAYLPPRFRFALVAMGILMSAVAVGGLSLLLTLPVRTQAVYHVDNLVTLATVLVLFLRARKGGPYGRFFLFLGLALLSRRLILTTTFIADHGVSWLQLGPRIRFLLTLVGPVLQGVAIFCWPTISSGARVRWRQALDAFLFTASIFLVFWLLGLDDLVSRSQLPTAHKTAQLVFFLDYALLIGFVIYRGLDSAGRFANALGWLLATYLAVSASNLVWIGLYLSQLYAPGHPLDATAPLLNALFLVTALAPVPANGDRVVPPSRLSTLVLPYLPFALAMPLMVRALSIRGHAPNPVSLWLALGIFVLLLVRQLVAMWDLNAFARSLERKVLERTRALEESQALLLRTQRMNLLATLGAGVAHDLNNLLSLVSLTTETMEEKTQAGQPPAPKDLALLRSAAHQASDLTRRLMEFGRRGEAQLEEFDLRDRLQKLGRILERLAPRVRFTWDLGAQLLPLRLDPVHIEQILVNLVANARDAMPQGGQLRLSTARRDTPERAWAELTVTDTGTGIPPENLPRLFEAFFTTKEPGKGTGLGLASVKSIVDECGATIAVESQVGVGTTFTLHFPLED